MPEPRQPKRTQALVIVSADYLRSVGLERTFPRITEPSVKRVIVPVFEFNLEDGSFAELRFCPTLLNGDWMHLFIPKHAVLAIIRLQTPFDSTPGFQPEEIDIEGKKIKLL